jgi:hypothetical protein
VESSLDGRRDLLEPARDRHGEARPVAPSTGFCGGGHLEVVVVLVHNDGRLQEPCRPAMQRRGAA